MERTKFGKLVAAKLVELDMSQRELAERVFVDQVTLSRWIRGKQVPKLTDAVAVLVELGLGDTKVEDLT